MATIRTALPMAGGRNLIADPRLDSFTLNPRGATVNDTHPVGAPDGGSFFRRDMVTSNTSSPMNGPMSGSGTAGIPVVAGQDIVSSCYVRKTSGGPSFRLDVNWYNASGALVANPPGTNHSPNASWNRFSQTFTAPALSAFFQPWLTWSGTGAVNQTLDLAMAQVELGTVPSDWTDNRTLSPLAVLNYATRRASRNVTLDLLGSKYPTVFLREAQSKSGTLSLLFRGDVAAREAEDYLGSPNRFTFSEPSVGEEWDFIVSGAVTRTRVTGTSMWIVDAEVREVEP